MLKKLGVKFSHSRSPSSEAAAALSFASAGNAEMISLIAIDEIFLLTSSKTACSLARTVHAVP